MHTLRRVIRSTVVGGEEAGSDADGEGEAFSTLALDSAHDAFIRGGKKFLSSALKTLSTTEKKETSEKREKRSTGSGAGSGGSRAPERSASIASQSSSGSVGTCSFMYRYILRESCSQFDSLPLTSLTISPSGTSAAFASPVDAGGTPLGRASDGDADAAAAPGGAGRRREGSDPSSAIAHRGRAPSAGFAYSGDEDSGHQVSAHSFSFSFVSYRLTLFLSFFFPDPTSAEAWPTAEARRWRTRAK